MITLTIGNSISSITGLNAPQDKEIRSLLSYSLPPTQMQYRGFKGGLKRYLMNRRGEFPTGLLERVINYISHNANNLPELTVVDTRVKPKPNSGMFNLKIKATPRPEQSEAANMCAVMHRGIITAPTGSGKSLIVALIINRLQVKTLVVVPSLELKRQLSESLKEAFGTLKNIDVENIDTLTSTKYKTKHYDCVIIDEFHHSGAKSYREVNKKHWNNVFYKFGLTATPFRSQDHETILLESVLSKVIYWVTYEECVKNGYIVPMEAYYIEVPKTKPLGNTSKYASMYSELIVNCHLRNQAISALLMSLNSGEKSTLCLVKEILHGEILSKGIFTFIRGENTNNDKLLNLYNSRKIHTVVATTGTLGEGVDTKPCEFVIIATPVKSKNLFMQMVGRAFRNYPGKTSAKVILLKDSSHKWFKSAFAEQCRILEQEYGVMPSKIELKTD